MTTERTLSLLFALGVVVYSLVLQPMSLLLLALIQLTLPLAAIWCSEPLSQLSGQGDSVTPPILIRICGWILLLLTPLGIYFFKLRMEW